MKFIVFQGGLGNQLFQYAYYLYIKKKYPKQNIQLVSLSKKKVGHYGVEIDKWFDVELPPETFLSRTIGYALYKINRFNYYHNLPVFLVNMDNHYNENMPLYYGYWQNVKYLNRSNYPKFRDDLVLGDENEKILLQLQNTNSVSVHVRRGDYLKKEIAWIFGNICTEDYYRKAISLISKRVENPHFFFFSDDKEYVNGQFKDIDNKVVVSCNSGERSFFDLYLMSKAKNMILANSSFSCWAAYLNLNNGLVVCPPKWTNEVNPPLVIQDNWIVIE